MTKLGRPSTYTEEMGREICDAIATGTEGIPPLCRENKHWPTERQIHRWLNMHEGFCQMYLKAKLTQSELRVEEIEDLASDASKDYVLDKYGNVCYNKDGVPVVNTAYMTRLKLKIQNRQWHAARLLPRYMDKAQNNNNNSGTMTHECRLKELK